MKTLTKNKILKLFALLTMLTCIVITFLGSNFKPMKNIYADQGGYTVIATEDIVLPDDLRPIKVGDSLSGKHIYVKNFNGNVASVVIEYTLNDSTLVPNCTLQFVYIEGPQFYDLVCPGQQVSFFYGANEPVCVLFPESTQPLTVIEVSDSYNSGTLDEVFLVSSSEMGDVIDETPSDDPTEEPTDETPGIIEGIGNETLDFFANSLGLGAGAVVGFSLIILLLTLIFRKK